MRVAAINMVSYGSTGNIMLNIAKLLRNRGSDAKTFSARIFSKKRKKLPPAPEGHFHFGSSLENGIHKALAQFTGLNGCFSHRATRTLIKELKTFKPDIIHLHNLHMFCINLPMLFRYIKRAKIPVVWTLHDCWTFTGHCPHFIMAKCDKWKTECHKCPRLSVYPKSSIDSTRTTHRLKKKWFLGVENMTLVTPSQWLSDRAHESFLKEYPIEVINNGIDLSVFKPIESGFRSKYHLEDKKIILAVAGSWGIGKGIDVVENLSRRLSDEYQIVVVGTDRNNDTENKNIIFISRTESQTELAKIYTAADVFINPTREDTFPTVNIEALSCGTPVITFKTGGSPEIIDESCGSVVEVDNIDAMEAEIIRICTTKPYTMEACINRAKHFDMYERFADYISLYERMTNT